MRLFCPECQATYSDATLSLCPRDGSRLYEIDPEDPLIGTIIEDRFRIDWLLGTGGMGAVYKGVQLSVGRDVAIKVLRSELATKEVALERFLREAQMVSQLTHPNIVKLIDFGQDRNRKVLYLVMELVQGKNLGDLLEEGRLRIAFALDHVWQVCGALTEPHSRGIIHRDLKPDNLILSPISDGSVQARVLDFGIARALEDSAQLTASGMICGTPAYMAPEQAQNQTLDARTDLYALGIMLYEMISGHQPFTGGSSLQIMLKHISEMARMLRDVLPPASIPPDVEALVNDLMSKNPSGRPENAKVVRERIDAIRKSHGYEPVVIDPTSPGSELFSNWLLPRLPGSAPRSGQTEALRRETGADEWFTRVDDEVETTIRHHNQGKGPSTENEFSTMPVSAEHDRLLAADRRVKVPTRSGPGQAWTPSDQAAVVGISATRDEGKVSVESQRRTEMEDVDSLAPSPAPKPRATQQGQTTAPRARTESGGGLIYLAIFLCVLTVAVGVGVFWYAFSLTEDPSNAVAAEPLVEAPIAEQPEPTRPTAELDPDLTQAAISTALAGQRAQLAIESALKSATLRARRPPSTTAAKTTPRPKTEPEPKTVTKEGPRRLEDALKGLREEF